MQWQALRSSTISPPSPRMPAYMAHITQDFSVYCDCLQMHRIPYAVPFYVSVSSRLCRLTLLVRKGIAHRRGTVFQTQLLSIAIRAICGKRTWADCQKRLDEGEGRRGCRDLSSRICQLYLLKLAANYGDKIAVSAVKPSFESMTVTERTESRVWMSP